MKGRCWKEDKGGDKQRMEGRYGHRGEVWWKSLGKRQRWGEVSTLPCLSLLVVCFATKLSSCVGSLGETKSMLVSFDLVGCSGGLGAWNNPRDGSDQVGSLSD